MAPSQDVSLSELIQEVLELFAVSIKDKNIQVNISPNLPIVYGDHRRFFEVFQNLIENSIKYMGSQPNPEIEIGVYKQADENIVYIKDNGIGIDPRYQECVFGLFNQLNQKCDGTGVGLAIVKRVIEFYGGKIWIESEGEGKGTTFYFILPVKKGLNQNNYAGKESPLAYNIYPT